LIYINAVGQDPDASGDSVFLFGNGNWYPCTIPAAGVTDTYISCETSDSMSDTDVDNLAVNLVSYNTLVTTSAYTVSYTAASTPYLEDVYPSAGFGASTINYYGIHRISNIGDGMRNFGDIVALKLGNDICSRLDIFQSAINPNTNNYITCT
jgi:hypothetical protein